MAVDWARTNYAEILGQDPGSFANGSTVYHLKPGVDPPLVLATISGSRQFHVSDSVNVKMNDSVEVTPPGRGLASLLEDQLGGLQNKSVDDLMNLLPRLMSDDLALAGAVSLNRNGQVVSMTIENSAFASLFSSPTRFAAEKLGCPMTSAVAVLLARESGGEVTMTCNYSDETKTVASTFELLRIPSEPKIDA